MQEYLEELKTLVPGAEKLGERLQSTAHTAHLLETITAYNGLVDHVVSSLDNVQKKVFKLVQHLNELQHLVYAEKNIKIEMPSAPDSAATHLAVAMDLLPKLRVVIDPEAEKTVKELTCFLINVLSQDRKDGQRANLSPESIIFADKMLFSIKKAF